MDSHFMEIISKIKNEGIREKVAGLVENSTITIDGKIYRGMPLDAAPAGLSRHHSYPGGLVEHIIGATEIALALCDVVEKVYHGEVDRDLVLAGVILHDIFKPLTYENAEDRGYKMTPLADRIDHLTLIVSELVRLGFSLDLVHIVCAHHGGQAGPIWPRTVEALICHLADLTDSRLNGEVLRAARFLSREVTREELNGINSKEAFEIVTSKAIEGWKGVRKTVERIRRERPNAH
ncbi:MAG: HD domain-containing protein [Candidatus Bathyarchaeota archaeon]|nr:MAG: HD domain-containing protein [Candidatus Bathyarchaeota archaeon]